MQRDFQAVEFVLNRVKQYEPCAVLGTPQTGEIIVYKELIKKLGAKVGSHHVMIMHITSDDELNQLVQMVSHNRDDLILMVYLSLNKDSSWFIEELEKLRLKRSTSFVPVIIAGITEVKVSYERSDKILTRSLFILKPTEQKDSEILLDNFISRYEYTPTHLHRAYILETSSGIAGLMKSLYLLATDHPNQVLHHTHAVADPAIRARLKNIFDFLGPDLIQKWGNNTLTPHNELFLQELGYETMPALFREYMGVYFSSIPGNPLTDTQMSLGLSSQEQKVFNLFSNHVGEIVTRLQIGEALWGAESRDQISDLAIDTLIHRLRNKVEQSVLGYRIITKKGRGFLFEAR